MKAVRILPYCGSGALHALGLGAAMGLLDPHLERSSAVSTVVLGSVPMAFHVESPLESRQEKVASQHPSLPHASDSSSSRPDPSSSKPLKKPSQKSQGFSAPSNRSPQETHDPQEGADDKNARGAQDALHGHEEQSGTQSEEQANAHQGRQQRGGHGQRQNLATGSSSSVAAVPFYAPSPSYPVEARRQKWEGQVKVRLVVDPQGQVLKALLLQSSSHPLLDASALKTLKTWRFPRHRGGCTEHSYTVPITFSLEE